MPLHRQGTPQARRSVIKAAGDLSTRRRPSAHLRHLFDMAARGIRDGQARGKAPMIHRHRPPRRRRHRVDRQRPRAVVPCQIEIRGIEASRGLRPKRPHRSPAAGVRGNEMLMHILRTEKAGRTGCLHLPIPRS